MFKTLDNPNSIKDIDSEKGIVVRYASSFNTVDSHGDRTIKGCFENTIKHWGINGKDRIKSLWQHDPSKLVAKPLELREDEFGLLVTDKFSQTPFAQDVLTLIKEGIIKESSIGYSVKKGAFNETDGVYELKEVQLYENSYVTWGSNDNTPIVDVKSKELLAHLEKQDDVFTQMKSMESALRNGTFETDEIPTMLELALAMWEGKLKAITELEEPKEEKIVITTEEKKTEVEEESAQADTDEVPTSEEKAQQALQDMLLSMKFSKMITEAKTLKTQIKGV